MNSRDSILGRIKKNKPAELPLPEPFSVVQEDEDLIKRFTEVLQSIGGVVKTVRDRHEMLYHLQQCVKKGRHVVNAIPWLAPYNVHEYVLKAAEELETVQCVFLSGQLGVAENGSVWLSEKDMGNRLLPFICEELYLVIKEENLVANMHEAYKEVWLEQDGYNVFIAGPSKTADIEQSLVIGAHGPLHLEVFIIRNRFDFESLV